MSAAFCSVQLLVALKDMDFDYVEHWLGQLLQPCTVIPLSSGTIVKYLLRKMAVDAGSGVL